MMHRSAQLACAALVMAGCAVTSPQSAIVVPPSVAMHAAFATALRAGRVIEARELIAGELRSQPDNGYLHLLNALTLFFIRRVIFIIRLVRREMMLNQAF